MTLEFVPVEKFRVHEPFRGPDPNGPRHDGGDHSASQADDQCRFCLRGPIMEAVFRYTDPRRDALEKLLQRDVDQRISGQKAS